MHLRNFPINYDSSIATPTVHHSVFDSTTNIDNSVTIISIDYVRIIRSKFISFGDEYNNTFKDYRTYEIIKGVYVSFKLKSTHIVSQLKYDSRIIGYKGIFTTSTRILLSSTDNMVISLQS